MPPCQMREDHLKTHHLGFYIHINHVNRFPIFLSGSLMLISSITRNSDTCSKESLYTSNTILFDAISCGHHPGNADSLVKKDKHFPQAIDYEIDMQL